MDLLQTTEIAVTVDNRNIAFGDVAFTLDDRNNLFHDGRVIR